jgi:hypothetical protein
MRTVNLMHIIRYVNSILAVQYALHLKRYHIPSLRHEEASSRAGHPTSVNVPRVQVSHLI